MGSMSRSADRPLWIPVKDMVPAGSIGAELIPEIFDLGERERPVTTFDQRFTILPSFTRQHPDLVTYGDILRYPAEELDKFNRRFRLRERLTEYLEDQRILPHSRLLQTVYGWPVFPAPARQEREIVTGVEDVLNQMQSTRRKTVLIRHFGLYFGLYDGITRTLEEIVGYLEEPVTRKGVRQIEARSFRYLRHPAIARLMRGYRVLPEKSLGREVFGATLIGDLPDLDGEEDTEKLYLNRATFELLRYPPPDLKRLFDFDYFYHINDLVTADLSNPRNAHFSGLVKDEIASALQRRVVEIAGKARREAEQKALDEAWRRARIGEPANNLVPQITLTREQLEQLDGIPVENLDLKIHIYYDLMRGGIETVGELLGMTKKQLLAVKNIGVKKALQITTRLAEFLKSQ